MDDFEKLGSFYLGRSYDLAQRKRGESLVLYDSKDLVTHAVCVGMTGSGKTGLCLNLLEEAAIDGVPSIIVDPKGDLANLLLTFPGLSAAEFQPWINEDDAARKGQTPAEFAGAQAELWKKGLAEWGQDGARIQRLRDAADFTVYTPGSSAGVSVSILKSLSAPSADQLEDREWLRDRINTTSTSLLALMGIEADPVKSREHILLTTLIHRAWSDGKDLDLAALIQQIQSPPVTRVGVLELESFFPAQDRFSLAMQFNNLLASPGFSAWMEGEALDIGAMLHTAQGKPRVAIFSIAHLADTERMFFVSLLMNQILGWVRTQSGTTSLRAIVYMDEIAGYFPPVANPPSKQPMLTLMKQARAYGVGMVLATQNPVDLDYKGLANAGTWFIGRLQTERDKARVLDGLEGAAAAASATFDRARVESVLSQLSNRIFLMNNVHEDGPEIIETRWALSYLRGPLTRQQIRKLTGGRAAIGGSAVSMKEGDDSDSKPVPPPAVVKTAAVTSVTSAGGRSVLPPSIPEFFIRVRQELSPETTIVYKPMLLGSGKVYFKDEKLGVDSMKLFSFITPIGEGVVSLDWDHAEPIQIGDDELDAAPRARAGFEKLPSDASKPRSYELWKKSFAEMIYRTQAISLYRSSSLKVTSKVGESEMDLRLKLQQLEREQRDAFAAKLRQKYAPKMTALQERIRRAQQVVDVQKSQARDAKLSTALSFGTAVLSAFLGRKTLSAGKVNKAASAARGVSRSAKESGDVGRAEETVQSLQEQLVDLEAQFQSELDASAVKHDPMLEEFEEISIKPKKTNISVRAVVLAWAPYVQRGGEVLEGWR